MSGAKLLTGRLTAKATSYTDTITRTIGNTQWTYEDDWDIIYRVPLMGANPYYVQPVSFTLDGSVRSGYEYSDMAYDVEVYDNNNNIVWSSAHYNHLADTLTASTLTPELYADTDIAYRVQFRMYRFNGRTMDRTNLNDFTATISVDYDDMEDPPDTSPPPFELPDDWVQNTTNTIADEFVPFETVTTPIDLEDTSDTVDQVKDFLEGVQDYETLANVFIGYVSELLRLKGLTAFLCFAICMITIITVFEMSGGD